MRDKDIREALHRELRGQHAHEPDTLIIDELGLCQGSSRVDVAVVNGILTGYEIKSPRDTLERLPVQQETYSKVLNRVVIVAAEEHVKHVRNIVPDWWGIYVPAECDTRIDFYEERPPRENPSLDPYAIVQLLWREEALQVLERLGLDRGVRTKPRSEIWSRLANSLPVPELANLVLERIKARKGWRSGE